MKRTLIGILVLVLVLVCLPGAAAFAEENYADVSDHVLQAGGWLPEAAEVQAATGFDVNAVKQAIYNGLSARAATINIQAYNVPTEDVGGVYQEVLNENPELFFVNSGFSYYSYGTCVTSITPDYNTAYGDGDVTDYQNTVQQILGMLDPNWSDEEKLLFLHDYLVTHCEYDTSLQRHNAHDALVVGSAVCQGYALAFNDLCRKAGITSSVISSQTLNHAWNLVTADGANCYVDCTWDDPSNRWYEAYCGHRNFMLSRDAFHAGVSGASAHDSEDWTTGTVNVYENMATTTQYDSAWWQDGKGVITAVPLIGHIAAYTVGNDFDNVYMRDMSGSSVTTLSLPASAYWNVWGQSGSYWSMNYSSAATLDGVFYFTLPTEIWSLSLEGKMECVYQMTEDECAQGYLYGIVSDGGTLYYNLGTKAYNTDFQRADFEPSTVTGESGGFTYVGHADGMATITGCALTGEVVIPSTLGDFTVTSLASELFADRDDITSVTIPATVTYFGNDPTDNDWDYVFSYCFGLENIFVDENNPTFRSVNGVLYSKDKKTLINYPCNHPGAVFHVSSDTLCCTSFAACQNLKFLFLDNPSTSWYTYTFNNTGNLTVFFLGGGAAAQKVSEEIAAGRVHESDSTRCRLVNAIHIYRLPDQLEFIENEAFQATGLQYVDVPDSCMHIGAGAFTGGALEYVHVGAQTVIDEGAFDSTAVIDRE